MLLYELFKKATERKCWHLKILTVAFKRTKREMEEVVKVKKTACRRTTQPREKGWC